MAAGKAAEVRTSGEWTSGEIPLPMKPRKVLPPWPPLSLWSSFVWQVCLFWLSSEDTAGSDSGQKVKGSEPPTHPGPGRGGHRPEPHCVLGTCAVDGGLCLGEAVPTLLFSLSAFQLILTIVGTIAGIVILGMVITLIVSMRYGTKCPFLGSQPPALHSGFQTHPAFSRQEKENKARPL